MGDTLKEGARPDLAVLVMDLGLYSKVSNRLLKDFKQGVK